MKIKKILLIFLPVLVFIIVISVNFFKPFGFFRESNPAMVCINYNFWKNYPSLKEHGIPVETYRFDPSAKPETQLWSTVASFGSGWFLLPYYFFSIFNFTPSEIAVRIFSLFWLAFTLLTIYFICKTLTDKTSIASSLTYLTIIFYLFNASVLWYHVEGYVHEIAVLPFYFLGWLFFLKYIQTRSLRWLISLGLCLFIGVQFDWLPCFQAVVVTIYLFLKRKKIENSFAFLIPPVSVVFGIIWIIHTYANWATLDAYTAFLKDKFLSRTVGSGGLQLVPGLNFNFNIILFYLASYGLLAVLFVWGLAKEKTDKVLMLMIISAVLHHLVFWGFSSEHDHAVVKMAFPIAFIAASVISTLQFRKQVILSCLVIGVNIGIYFFLHNFYIRKGMYSNPNFCYQVGKIIHDKFSEKDQYVFINTEGKYLLQIEFYAGKFYTMAASLEDARQILHTKYSNGKGYFIDEAKESKVIQFK